MSAGGQPGDETIDRAILAAVPAAARELAAHGVRAAIRAAEGQYGYLGSLVNMRVVESEDGDSVLTMDITPNALNSHGYVHGGMLFTFADYAMGAAARSLVDEDHAVVTLEAKANYLTNVKEGTLIARCQTLHHGQHVIMLETRIEDARSGDLVVIVTGTFYVVRKQSSS